MKKIILNIIYYAALALLFVAVPMALVYVLPTWLTVGILAVVQLFTLVVLGTVIQDLKARNRHDEEEAH